MSYSKEEKQREEKMFPTLVRYRETDAKLHRKASRRAQNVALTFRGFKEEGKKENMVDRGDSLKGDLRQELARGSCSGKRKSMLGQKRWHKMGTGER